MPQSSQTEAVRAHIMAIFGERYGPNAAGRGFVSEVDNLKNQGNSTKQAVERMVDGGRFLIPTEAQSAFLKGIGAMDGRVRNPEKITDLYRTTIAKEGAKLYDSIRKEPNGPTIVSESPKTSYNAAVIKAMQEHILSAFEDYDDGVTPEQGFVKEVEERIRNDPEVHNPMQAIQNLYQGGTWLIYYPEIQEFLKSIGVDDGKKHEGYESADLYARMLQRDGVKLYNKLKTASRGGRASSNSPKPRKRSCDTPRDDSIKDSARSAYNRTRNAAKNGSSKLREKVTPKKDPKKKTGRC